RHRANLVCGQLMQTRTQWGSPGWLCAAIVHSSPGGRSTFKVAYMVMIADWSVPCGFIVLVIHHSVEDEHVHALRSRERGCFLVGRTLWADKIQSITDAGSLNTFG